MTADVGVPTVRRPLAPVWLWVSLLIVAAPLVGTALGETPIPLSTVWQALANQMLGAGYPLDPIDQGIVWAYRLPRALVAGACGAGLAISGLVLQTLLRNALADPYLLGISAGASTGAVTVAVAGIGAGFVPMSAGALLGAIAAFALVVGLARLSGGGPGARGAAQIVLAGIAGSQLFNALTSFIIARSASAEQARGIMFWLLGNLSGVRWDDVGLSLAAARDRPWRGRMAYPRAGRLCLRHGIGGVPGRAGPARPGRADPGDRHGHGGHGVGHRCDRLCRAGRPACGTVPGGHAPRAAGAGVGADRHGLPDRRGRDRADAGARPDPAHRRRDRAGRRAGLCRRS